MNELVKVFLIYFTGGITFIPIILVLVLYLSAPTSLLLNEKDPKTVKNAYTQGKKGWIRITKLYNQRESMVMAGIQLYVQGTKRQKEHVFAELKGGALFIYHDEQQDDCLLILPIHNYQVSMFSTKNQCQDHEIFGKSTAIKLSPNKDIVQEDILLDSLTTTDELFITCVRPIDKEDWYFGLLASTQMMTEEHIELVDTTHFDPSAMETLMNTMQKDAAYREVQWLNAIIGRLFLSLYKTDEMKQFFQSKITKKAQKIKLPSYLGEIVINSVDIGPSIPFITQPKLLSFTPEGDLMAEAAVHYAGGLCVVIQTDLRYSSLRVPLVLSVKLKHLSGKIILKVKPPPTNRYWISFESMPVMDCEITPIVSDKQIRLSMVTNAIQSKIREFMMENVVMPNMEDFAFCPSDGLGGIFGDRIPKPSTPPPSPKLESGIQFDMLGNKVAKKMVPLKIIESSPEVARIRRYSNPRPIKISLFSK